MGFAVVRSSASHQRIARTREWLEARAPAEEVLIIGATLDAANELSRCVVQAKGATFGYHRLTLGQLAAALARPGLATQRTVPLSALGVEAVASRTIHKLSQAGALGRYAKLKHGPGFASAIARVITELRLEHIKADALAALTPDLRHLLRAYEQELAEHGFTDWPGVLNLAAAAATDREYGHQLLGLPTLLLDVPITTASELAFVRAVCTRAPDVLITVPTNDAATSTRLRGGLGAEIIDLDSRPERQVQSQRSLPRL